MEQIFSKIDKNEELSPEELDELYELYLEDEEIIEMGRHGDVFYDVIFYIPNKGYYIAEIIRNDEVGRNFEPQVIYPCRQEQVLKSVWVTQRTN